MTWSSVLVIRAASAPNAESSTSISPSKRRSERFPGWNSTSTPSEREGR
jgi:hypothetical protein